MASKVEGQSGATAPERVPMGTVIDTDIAARLDRLPWGRFHVLVIIALGITWVLDGLEVTLAGSLVGALRKAPMSFSEFDVGLAASSYLVGAVVGALGFGWLTDRIGRKKLFFITLALYLVATAASGLSWDIWSFCVFRFLTGAGIGGEYTAINSTIQELVPARVRGWTDLVINGSFWIGAALGSFLSIAVLKPEWVDPVYGWRIAFFVGGGIGLVILFLRSWIPESPRWLATHGYTAEADRVVSGIEKRFTDEGITLPPVDPKKRMKVKTRSHTPLSEVASAMLVTSRTQTFVGLALMIAQAFFYNALFFTYALVLERFYGVPGDKVGWYLLPFALGSFMGPLLLGRLFDTVGRRPMIAFTYGISAVLLAVAGYLFKIEVFGPVGQTAVWMVVFFFASAAASSAYLTVAETFPLEIRALAIATFYAIGTGIGGVSGPLLFGALVESGSRDWVLVGYLIGAALMAVASVVGWIWGTAAEGRSLEDVSRPLAAA
ncbi:MFS transporter [Methylobacterium haplocladii]|uniref:MFS transporter n=1 Tax=Methylobacterium haplocladii TaxID=1176176 RepID=A0A512ILA5_9HYPH|nr:MFS transporter [Methylobacterium haplocladii]GEO98503.1 MFS transporter [Methylobacterium haplocladii]GJD82808.1 Inner membrane metabolite transport protein YdjE [Methylobacterium haplocladii]GLS60187.1 MFS transporter [Methylobacterium haplocladii]